MAGVRQRCTRALRFCAGHRLVGHEGPCRHLHGHNYSLVVSFEGVPDSSGMIIDLAIVKTVLGGWIDEHWDHGFLLWENDTEARAALSSIDGQKIFFLPSNPSVEELARYLLTTVCPSLFDAYGVSATEIELRETENCSARVTMLPGV